MFGKKGIRSEKRRKNQECHNTSISTIDDLLGPKEKCLFLPFLSVEK